MLDLLIDAAFLAVLTGILYGVYLIPPVKRRVKYFAYKHWEILVAVLCALFASAVMIYVILPRM